ncbi:hypothetical protein AGLY_009135 [Aphis glycines]|uniref:Uncharacterized protein n=1 Tax=Aphis glycines TaxID=307491 RepID=A0A6G0TJQ4_APHGL|nr:hypothetical protein AGLY_009135 [Aphis glycines]
MHKQVNQHRTYQSLSLASLSRSRMHVICCILCRAFNKIEKSSSGVQLVLDTSRLGRSDFNRTSPDSNSSVKSFNFIFSINVIVLNCGPGRSYRVNQLVCQKSVHRIKKVLPEVHWNPMSEQVLNNKTSKQQVLELQVDFELERCQICVSPILPKIVSIILTFVKRKRFLDADNRGVLLQIVQHGAVRVPNDVNVETLADQRLRMILHPWASTYVAQDHYADVFLYHFHGILRNR